jgi:hypothetical protein
MINIPGFYYLSVFDTIDSIVEEIAHEYFSETYDSVEKGSRKALSFGFLWPV